MAESDVIPQSIPTRTAVVLACTLVSGAFSAGVTFQLARDAARAEIAAAVAPVKLQADAARAEAFGLRQEIKALRVDLARGIGRALAPPVPTARDWAGKTAAAMYDRERAEGVPEEEALKHVMESDL